MDEVAQNVRNIGNVPYPLTILTQLSIAQDRVEEFTQIVQVEAMESKLEKGCLRYDILEDQDKPTNFTLYQVFKNGDAIADHVVTKHHQAMKNFEDTGGFDQKEE